MTDESDSLILALLRKIDERTEQMVEDLHEIKGRMTSVEEGLTGVNLSLYRLEGRVERIERQLELPDAAH